MAVAQFFLLTFVPFIVWFVPHSCLVSGVHLPYIPETRLSKNYKKRKCGIIVSIHIRKKNTDLKKILKIELQSISFFVISNPTAGGEKQ